MTGVRVRRVRRIDYWLLRALIRRNPGLVDDAGQPPLALAGTRVHSKLSRYEVADAVGHGDAALVLAFEMGLTDPTMSEMRRYAHAVGTLLQWRVEWSSPDEED